MFEENKENLVAEATEKTVEQPVEQNVEGIELTDTTPKVEEPIVEKVEEPKARTYTDKDLDEILAKKIARERVKMEKEYESKLSSYKNTENVLNAGLGTKTIDEATQKLRDYYVEQGVNIPDVVKPQYSEREEQILAKAEAEELIDLGISEMTEEANRLANKGYQNLNNREKVIFNTLAERLTYETKKTELAKNGINADVLEDKEFKAFANDFNPKKSVVEIYNLFNATKKPKEEVQPIGSMASTSNAEEVKDFYTSEEFDKLTEKNSKLLDNPSFMSAVRKSMAKW